MSQADQLTRVLEEEEYKDISWTDKIFVRWYGKQIYNSLQTHYNNNIINDISCDFKGQSLRDALKNDALKNKIFAFLKLYVISDQNKMCWICGKSELVYHQTPNMRHTPR